MTFKLVRVGTSNTVRFDRGRKAGMYVGKVIKLHRRGVYFGRALVTKADLWSARGIVTWVKPGYALYPNKKKINTDVVSVEKRAGKLYLTLDRGRVHGVKYGMKGRVTLKGGEFARYRITSVWSSTARATTGPVKKTVPNRVVT